MKRTRVGYGEPWDTLLALGWSGCIHDSDCACSAAVHANDRKVFEAFDAGKGEVTNRELWT